MSVRESLSSSMFGLYHLVIGSQTHSPPQEERSGVRDNRMPIHDDNRMSCDASKTYEAYDAFNSELEELLKSYHGYYVAYNGRERIGPYKSYTTLKLKCKSLGLDIERLIVGRIAERTCDTVS
jgi:hypothetical protein